MRTWSIRYPLAGRIAALGMSCVMALTACSGQLGSPPLTPAQQQLEQANRRFKQTVIEGAVVGAVVLGVAGGLLGALAGRDAKSVAVGTAAGAALGGAIGAAAGYDTARKNYEQARTETNLIRMITEANQDVEAYQRSAEAARKIAVEAQTRVALLDAQYKAGSITAESYRRDLATYRGSDLIIADQVSQIVTKVAALRDDAGNQSDGNRAIMLNDAKQMEDSGRTLQKSHDSLAAVLAMTPA